MREKKQSSAVDVCQIDRVRRRQAELLAGLRRHTDIEEAVIFPVIEGQTATSGARRTALMRLEHREISGVPDHVRMLCSSGDRAMILRAFDHPIERKRLFRSHCLKEKAYLYPFMDEVFDRAESRELLAPIQGF